ncbi:MAG: nicotinamide-nucleotide amidohydrolase family protein [Candidatus Glassbacteria bacterium]
MNNPIRTAGISQKKVLEFIRPFRKQYGLVSLDTRRTMDGVDVFIYNAGLGQREYKRVFADVKEALSRYVFGFGDDTLRDAICRILIKSRKRLAIAESLTGGRVSDRLTDVPGSSKFFMLSVIAYSNESKIKLLGVPKEVIRRWGAVSRRTCGKMMEGLSTLGDFHFKIAVTGTAGPTGGTPKKPVGTVYVGIQDDEATLIKKFRFTGTRSHIKERTCAAVMQLLWKRLIG